MSGRVGTVATARSIEQVPSSAAAPTSSSGLPEASENKAQRQRRSTHAQATARLIARSLFSHCHPRPALSPPNSSSRCVVPCAVVLLLIQRPPPSLSILTAPRDVHVIALKLRHLAGCRRWESFDSVACGLGLQLPRRAYAWRECRRSTSAGFSLRLPGSKFKLSRVYMWHGDTQTMRFFLPHGVACAPTLLGWTAGSSICMSTHDSRSLRILSLSSPLPKLSTRSWAVAADAGSSSCALLPVASVCDWTDHVHAALSLS